VKYEMVHLNISNTKGEQLANIIDCKLSHIPITYLGVSLHFKKLTAEHWNFLLGKIEKKNYKVGKVNYCPLEVG
jgi:hypothetical protein